jgi:hypothetical protein
MRRVWATVVAVWATLAIVGVLAWTRVQPAPLAQATPTVLVVKGKHGTQRFIVANTATAAAPHATTHTSPVAAR